MSSAEERPNENSLQEKSEDGNYQFSTNDSDITSHLNSEALYSILSHISESDSTMVLVTDCNRLTIWANKTFWKITGYRKEEIIGRNPGEILQGPNPDPELKKRMSAAFDAGEPFQCEILNYTKQNTPYWIHMDIQPVRDSGGTLTHFVAVQYDITERKRNSEQFRSSENKLRAILNSTQEGNLLISPDYKILSLNEAAINNVKLVFGRSISENDSILDFLLPETEKFFFLDTKKALTGEIVKRELIVNGFWFEFNYYPVFDDESVIGFSMNGTNIHSRKLAELSLQKEIESRSLLLDNIETQVWYLTDPSTYGIVNPAHAAFKGFKPEELSGKSFYELYSKEIADEWKEANEKVFKEKQPVRIEKWRPDTDGRLRYILLTKTPKLNEDGRVEYLVCTAYDQTEQKRAEEQLERMKNLLNDIEEISKTGGWEYTVEPQEMFWTDELFRIHEIEKNTKFDQINDSIECYMPEDRDTIREAFEKCLGEGVGYDLEFPFRTLKGNQRWIRTKTEPVIENGKVVKVIGSVIDITEQKKAEKERNELLHRFEQIGKTIPGFLYQFRMKPDGTSCIEYASPSIANLIGVKPEEAMKDISSLFSLIHSEDYEEVMAGIISGNQTLENWHAIFRVNLSGGSTIWVEGNATPVQDNDGSVLWTGYMNDVSKKVEAEQKLKEAKNEAEAASRAKSEFLAVMSHELRTPLNGVIGFSELLNNTSLSAGQHQYVNHINVSGNNLLQIINNILDLSKIEAGMLELTSERTDIIELIYNSLDIVKIAALKKNLELLLNVDPVLPQYVRTDPVRLTQILTNLLSNAIKFTESGEVELSAGCRTLGNGNTSILFSVRDTGIGITEEQKEKLFKAFSQADSSTTRKFGGTGLGLVISQTIARKMGGQIDYESIPNKGSRFYFEIEVEGAEPIVQQVNLPVSRCLVVDDHPGSRRILKGMLTHRGVEVVECGNGLEALKALEHDRNFNLLICDQQMPYMNGEETLQLIREKMGSAVADIHVIMLGFTDDENQFSCNPEEKRCFINKPVKAASLFACINRIHLPAEADANGKPRSSAGRREQDDLLPHHKASILIAEDVPLNMNLICALLGAILPDAELLKAEDGIQAMNLWKNHKPDLVLMDLQMPQMDGLEATRKIRKLEEQDGGVTRTPVIALTAAALREDRDQCLAAGMDDVLTKPIDTARLRLILTDYCKK
ncbi:MAG: PAS domain S-box protein [Balneolaceae bacterium]|nr:MAG: PAS domain S-box protein [Balneolaceae bacterium]